MPLARIAASVGRGPADDTCVTTRVEYQVESEAGQQWRFDIGLGTPNETTSRARHARPVWTELDEHTCACCPLAGSDATHCPAAVDLAPIVEAFDGLASITRVDVRVFTDEREYRKTTDLQELLRSLTGLV